MSARMTVAAMMLSIVFFTLPSCTMVASFPGTHAENDSARCQNGEDDDLNGRLDCAELSCASFCPSADVIQPASLLPCYSDSTRSLDFVQLTGELAQDARCLPWAPSAAGPVMRPECETNEVIFPGERSCALVGDACPAPGTWPVGLPAGTLYVRSAAVPMGSGTAADPFTRLAQALAMANDGDTIIVGEGLYVEPVELDRAITLRGVCADRVHVWSNVDDGVVRLSSPGAHMQDITVGVGTGATRPPIAVGIVVSTAGASLKSVVIDGVNATALEVADGASLVAERVAIRGLAGTASVALDVAPGGAAEVRGFSAEDLGGDAIVTAGRLHLEAAWVADADGVAVRAVDGAQVLLRGFASASTHGGTFDIDVRLDCADHSEPGVPAAPCAVVEDSWLDAEGGEGVVLRGGLMEMNRTLIQRAVGAGVHVLAGTLTVEDLAVTGGRSGATPGAGLRIEADGVLLGHRVLLRLNLLYGIDLLGGRLQLADLMVDGRVPLGTSAVGIHIVGGAVLIQGFSVSQAGICGIELIDVASAVLREGVVSQSPRGVCVRGGSATPGQLMSFIKFTADVQRPVFVESP